MNETTTTVVDKYREAAVKLFGVSMAEASAYIVPADEDPGEWAPDALAILYMECKMTFPEDTGVFAARMDYWGNGMENGFRLDAEAKAGAFIEFINPAVAAIWPA